MKYIKVIELATLLGALLLQQDLVSPPGPPNQVSAQLSYQTRVEELSRLRRVFLEARTYIYGMRVFHPLTLRMKG